MTYLPELTGLRAFAVALALASHTLIPLTGGGWVGVDVFFVLSGYLITSVLVDEQWENGRIRLGRFYAKRALRLYPALLVMLGICVLFYKYLGDGGTLSGYAKTAAIGGTYSEDVALGVLNNAYGGLGHTWSLAVEEQFYLLWAPVLLLFLKFRRSPVPFLIAASVASWVSLALTTVPWTIPSTYYRPDTRMNELFLGCLLAFLVRRHRQWLERSSFLRYWLAPLGLAGLTCVALYSNWHLRWTFPQQEMGAAFASAALVLGLAVGGRRAPVNRLFRLRPVVWLGTISYGIYIYFIPVFVLIPLYWHGWQHQYYEMVGIEVLCVVAVAALSYYLVERPFLGLKDRLGARSATPRGAHAPRPPALAPAFAVPAASTVPYYAKRLEWIGYQVQASAGDQFITRQRRGGKRRPAHAARSPLFNRIG
ncbi:MAG TPA: acyltransferase [Acidimicrobiales bacterium]|nr:acyltransferase [Acidimicrobiales bacterium]